MTEGANFGDQNLVFVEQLYADYLSDPQSVSADWRKYFASVSRQNGNGRWRLGPSFSPETIFNPPAAVSSRKFTHGGHDHNVVLHDRIVQLVRAYRVRGHLVAKIDPLGRVRPAQPELDPEFYGIDANDMTRTFSSMGIHTEKRVPVADLLDSLKHTYCDAIGVQYMHIDDLDVKAWLEANMEKDENRRHLSRAEQLLILRKLTDAFTFEEFLQKKFRGAKSFSLEGGESLIPLLTLAIEIGADQGLEEIVLGMPHRGRLNVLANILGKSAGHIFHEYDDRTPERFRGGGDVKYHLGYSADWKSALGNNIHLSLCFNPSHLEFVNTVVLGRVRAKQDRRSDRLRNKGMGILIHGDAAFIGEEWSRKPSI
ncbi:MAG: hypothetical protein R3C68_16510 [Myxococcota bacterium]